MNGWANNMKTYYIYRCIRMDKNEPFYIGKGTSYLKKGALNTCYSDYYKRGVAKSNKRSDFFNLISNKTKYSVDIIYETTDFNEINEKEKEFILLYGRIELGTGTLCNLTGGGDGIDKHGEAFYKSVNTRKENGVYEKIGKRNSVPVYVYDRHGFFLIKYDSKRSLAAAANADMTGIFESIKNKKAFRGYFLSNEYHPNGMDVLGYKWTTHLMNVVKINNKNEVVSISNTQADAAKTVLNGSSSDVSHACKTNVMRKGFNWVKVPDLKIFNNGNYNM